MSPYVSPTPCTKCGRIRCEEHKREARARHALYGRRWQRERLQFLREHPLCVDCKREGRIVGATVVDHYIAHRGDVKLFWDKSNWRESCKPCHDRKTALHDGGFGR